MQQSRQTPAFAVAAFAAVAPAAAEPMLADFDYPYGVHRFAFRSQEQSLAMAYMDVTARERQRQDRRLAAWQELLRGDVEGVAGGYRVVIPDQIGFCKSSKPRAYQFGLHQLAANTHALLASIGVERPIIIGHSMGGMLALRYALMYPGDTRGLIVVSPIGLEDRKAKGVPLPTIDQLYERELKTSFDSIKRYQQATYYAGVWRPQYDRWVTMLAGMYAGDAGKLVAWDQALTSDMILSQPVVYEFERIAVPTVLMIGQKDTTAIGKDRALPEIAQTLGNYPELGRMANRRIGNSTLVAFAELGHAPQVQDPALFIKALLEHRARLP